MATPQPISRHLKEILEPVARRTGKTVTELAKLRADPTTKTSSDKPTCDDCGDTGKADYNPTRYCDCEKGRPKQRKHQLRIMNIYDRAGCPDRFKGCDMEQMQESLSRQGGKGEALECAQRALGSGDKHSVLLTGPNGSGKTSLATAMLTEQYKRGHVVLWISYADLMQEIKAGYDNGEANSRLLTAQRVPVLLIDGLGEPFRDGAGQETDHNRQRFFEVMGHRHGASLPTYMTTNFSGINALSVRFDQTVTDRILELCYIAEMAGDNLRLVK